MQSCARHILCILCFNNFKNHGYSKLVSWSLTSLFSTNMAISETNGYSKMRKTNVNLENKKRYYDKNCRPTYSPRYQQLNEIGRYRPLGAGSDVLRGVLHLRSRGSEHWGTGSQIRVERERSGDNFPLVFHWQTRLTAARIGMTMRWFWTTTSQTPFVA